MLQKDFVLQNRINVRAREIVAASLYKHFIHAGPVEIDCEAHLDENLRPILLDVYDITPLQSDLGFFDSTPTS